MSSASRNLFSTDDRAVEGEIPAGALEEMIEEWRGNRIENYRRMPQDIREHAGIEETVTAGGYGYRQILELVQNGADAILEEQDPQCHNAGERNSESRIHVHFDGQRLYVANTGTPLTREGIEALLMSHSSPKRSNQIGRFGIGFKSLLRLGGTIDIFSRTVSLRFDPRRCQEEIRAACGLTEDAAAPSLRLAWCLDPQREVALDPHLASYGWASTVVRADVKNLHMPVHIGEEIRSFPARFLLFLPIPVELVLDAPSEKPRRITREVQDNTIRLLDGEEQSLWRIYEQQVRITDEAARADATHLHQRNEVPLAWAIPVDSRRQEAGSFWAFFPTRSQTRIPGILNAPWKLNSDRQAIIEGEWNRMLMTVAARMIVDALPGLADPGAPGQVLDYFPRSLDRKDELAATMVDAIWAEITRATVVPDASGELRPGSALLRMPLDDGGLPEQWCSLAPPEALRRWVHPTCLEGDRKSRLAELARRITQAMDTERGESALPCLETGSLKAWFEDIATTEAEAAKGVITLAGDCAQVLKPAEWNRDRADLQIILTRDGNLAMARDVFLALPHQHVPGQQFVADELVADSRVRDILVQDIKVRNLLEGRWRPVIEQALSNALDNPSAVTWGDFWRTLRCADENERRSIVTENRSRIHIRRRDGSWQYPDAVLKSGRVVSAGNEDEENTGVLVDAAFHAADITELSLMGLSDFPRETVTVEREDLLSLGYSHGRNRGDYARILYGWRMMAFSAYREYHPNMAQANYLPSRIEMPRGFILLQELQGLAKARLTVAILEAMDEKTVTVRLEHYRRPLLNAQIDVEHPLIWLLCRNGALPVSEAAVPLSTFLTKVHSPLMEKLHLLRHLLPKLRLIAPGATHTVSVKELHTFWKAVFDYLAHGRAVLEGTLNDLWNEAAGDGWVPDKLRGPEGEIRLSEVHYTGSADLGRRARAMGMVVVELDDHAAALWRQKGAVSLDELYRVHWNEVAPGAGLLQEVVPEISSLLAEDGGQITRIQLVSGLRTGLGGQEENIPCVHWKGVLYLDRDQLDTLPRQERLSHILKEAAVAGWLTCEPDEAVSRIADATLESRRGEVAKGAGLEERLLRAVADNVDALRTALGPAVLRALPADVSSAQIARLAVALLGPSLLQEEAIISGIDAADLRPPARWGSAEARAFVAALGFPDAYAESQGTRREPEILVSGPIPLPPLHDYQIGVRDGLAGLIGSGDGRRRAVVSLPTGGGKTRVTVQAAVELVLKPKGPKRSVLWIAQTDELCEQAVQAFRQVWINLGAQGVDLRVIRLWGGHANPAPPGEDEPIVAVASIQTLNSRIGMDALDWLARPGMVVLDECHHAITKSYTALLRWLDAASPRPAKAEAGEPPVIGLSATPFRMDDEESKRLARRFDQRWFPADQEDLYQKLLTGRFLARAEHAPLISRAVIPAALIDTLDSMIVSGDEFGMDGMFERINRELALDESRNLMLIEAIRHSEAKQILFFANSVDHAREMAARLCLLDIPAAAISSDTPRTTRRWFLNQFQDGKLRVMCNHSVLTTGFDAPRTDLVLIARQVRSPVSYMQMVGRGLRGPLNGGTETCQILTVLDNLGRFAKLHPYHYCANLYGTG